MKVAILFFSPSGNTRKASELLHKELELRNHSCQTIDFTRSGDCFLDNNMAGFLSKEVRAHDILVVCGPVYAHHLHYNVLNMIHSLPQPDGDTWGEVAIPLVTYGSISSGIALRDAGNALVKSGRQVPCGLKIAASHRMTRAFLDKEFNAHLSEEPIENAIRDLADRIGTLKSKTKIRSAVKTFSYNGLKAIIKATVIFQEKKWHEERYPKVNINQDLCSRCGKCMQMCPVHHIQRTTEGLMKLTGNSCIHCLNCFVACSKKAITLSGDIEKGRRFMSHMIECHANKEMPATAVYPLK